MVSKILNKQVADFKYKNRKYEIDLLLDSIKNGFVSYDVFDVTNDKKGKCVCQLYFEEGEYLSSELIEMAKTELQP